MARHLLSARQVQVARKGDNIDGDGLILRVKETSASWVFRYTAPNSRKRRELGLGAADRTSIEAAGASLKHARQRAEEARGQVERSVDPIDDRRGAKEVQRR